MSVTRQTVSVVADCFVVFATPTDDERERRDGEHAARRAP